MRTLMTVGGVVGAAAGVAALGVLVLAHAVGVQPPWGPPVTAGAAPATTVQAGPPRLRRLAPVDLVTTAAFARQQGRLSEGHVVVDLQALESLEGGEELVLHWRSNHGADDHLVCWLRAGVDDAGATAQADLRDAVAVLSQAGCSALRVAQQGPVPAAGGRPDAAADRQSVLVSARR